MFWIIIERVFRSRWKVNMWGFNDRRIVRSSTWYRAKFSRVFRECPGACWRSDARRHTASRESEFSAGREKSERIVPFADGAFTPGKATGWKTPWASFLVSLGNAVGPPFQTLEPIPIRKAIRRPKMCSLGIFFLYIYSDTVYKVK